MGSLFRSEDMRLCQMFLQTEAAYACVSELGELGLVQFKDLNANVNAFQRKFVTEVRRCEEMERKLRYMEKEIVKDGMTIPSIGENTPKAPPPKEMIDLEATFEKIDTELREVNTNYEALKQNYLELVEIREVLNKTQFYFAVYGQDIQHIMREEHGHEESSIGVRAGTAQLGFIVGTILREKVPVFERVMKFITHSNVFLRTEEIDQPLEDPTTGAMLNKCMFIVFFQGENLRSKVRKVCDAMRANVYPASDNAQERSSMLDGVSVRLADLDNILKTTKDHRDRILENARKEVRIWSIKVEKIKAIFHTLNMFKVYQNSLIAECWCPVKALDEIRGALTTGEKISGSTIPTVIQPMHTTQTPPTYFNTNKFTRGFQGIVNAYGIADYGEVNPAPYTCISFPFLFAVMFGDAGHGTLMFLFGAFMVLREKSLGAQKSNNEIWNTFFGGRYIIMMMGMFSIYTGLIYNDCFSKSFNIFGSQWRFNDIPDMTKPGDKIIVNALTNHLNGTAYFFGIDPVWQSANNKILFLNSFKMKLAVILGVTQMLFGICLSVFNHVHFKHTVYILIEFLPEILFLGCLFGYLNALVYYKWLTFDAATSKCAPPLLIHYINMFMFKYTSSDLPCDERSPTAIFYDGQKIVQTTMLLIAVLSIPVLLIGKPVYLICFKQHENKNKMYAPQQSDPLIAHEVVPSSQVNMAYQQDNGVSRIQGEHATPGVSVNSDEEDLITVKGDMLVADGTATQGAGADDGIDDPHEPGEIIIHQAIHTIEFCLGCISHTASYLRLWALSLAHAQLSEVLWQMVLKLGLIMGGAYTGAIALFIIFFFWACLTIAILLLMEGLSAFLHTLRLHWVEFQSKFYKGEGYIFAPFSFKTILSMESEDSA